MLDFSFFHCFSRRTLDAAGCENELFILGCILKWGLLLVPETIILPGEQFDQGRQGMPIQYIQRRLSLTLLTEQELRGHRQKFGKFAVEFDLLSGRQLGAVPVIYLPQPSVQGEYQALDAIGATILYRLREIFFVLAGLASLEDSAKSAKDTDSIELFPGSGAENRTVNVRAIKNVIEILGTNKQPFGDLVD
jgi:hypothetical protein